MYISVITDYFKLNLFHFKDELVAADWPVYTSTFGNINTYNAYVSLSDWLLRGIIY